MHGVERTPDRIASALHAFVPSYVSGAFRKLHIDSPLILCFLISCLTVQLVSTSLFAKFNINYFAIWPLRSFSVFSIVSYWRLLSHVLGHSSWQHFYSNAIYILLVGPVCEREYGGFNLFQIMVWTAVSSAVSFMLFSSSNSVQLGSSGIAFMLIILSSLAETRVGKIPVTFIIQVCVWVYKEAVDCVFSSDSVSHSAHLLGAMAGAVAGYHLHGVQVHRRAAPALLSWLRRAKAKR